MSFSPSFERIFEVVLAEEGAFTADPRDEGNWTGGEIGRGECRGTNFGISAAAYPSLDIEHLTREAALALYARDYWAPIRGDDLGLPVAWLVADGAVNSGVPVASRWLQDAVGATPDGVVGDLTLAALRARLTGGDEALFALLVDISQRRLIHLSDLSAWPLYRAGWVARALRMHSRAVREVFFGRVPIKA